MTSKSQFKNIRKSTEELNEAKRKAVSLLPDYSITFSVRRRSCFFFHALHPISSLLHAAWHPAGFIKTMHPLRCGAGLEHLWLCLSSNFCLVWLFTIWRSRSQIYFRGSWSQSVPASVSGCKMTVWSFVQTFFFFSRNPLGGCLHTLFPFSPVESLLLFHYYLMLFWAHIMPVHIMPALHQASHPVTPLQSAIAELCHKKATFDDQAYLWDVKKRWFWQTMKWECVRLSVCLSAFSFVHVCMFLYRCMHMR